MNCQTNQGCFYIEVVDGFILNDFKCEIFIYHMTTQ